MQQAWHLLLLLLLLLLPLPLPLLLNRLVRYGAVRGRVHTFAIVGICAAWMLFGRPRVTDRHAAGFGRLLLAYWFVRLNRLLY